MVARIDSTVMHTILVSPRLPAEDAGPVTDLSLAIDSSLQSGLQGRIAAFTNAQVQEVIGERIFWIGTGESQRLPVVLNPESTPEVEGTGTPSAGEEWALYGVFRELPPPGILRTDWDLSDEQISELEGHEVYLNTISAERATGADSEN